MNVEEVALPTWDIDPLVDGRGEEGVDALLDEARSRAEALAANKGKIARFTASDLAAFMTEYGAIRELVGRAGSFARLAFSADTQDPAHGA